MAGLNCETKALRVAVKLLLFGRSFHASKFFGGENQIMNPASIEALGDDSDCITHRRGDKNLNRFRENRPAQDFISLEFVQFHTPAWKFTGTMYQIYQTTARQKSSK